MAYFLFMLFGVFTVRLPAPGWSPGHVGGGTPQVKVEAGDDVHVDDAIRTPQFWLLWAVLCLNVTAGIGVLGQASPMIQEMFPGTIDAGAAAGFVGLLSLANMAGRFAWSSLSDVIGRQRTYMIFFALGAVLYASVPGAGRSGAVVLFVLFYVVIMSMYGGGFATIPAYLRDEFGTMHVGAIHGRLLTAWSFAGVAGPVLVNYLREYQIGRGVAARDAYSVTMYLMAGLLVLGFAANWFVQPVASRRRYAIEPVPAATGNVGGTSAVAGGFAGRGVGASEGGVGTEGGAGWKLAASWLLVGLPAAWGVAQVVVKSLALFR